MEIRRRAARLLLGIGLCLFGPAEALNAQEPKLQRTIAHENLGISCLLFAPDGKSLVSLSGANLKVWDLRPENRPPGTMFYLASLP